MILRRLEFLRSTGGNEYVIDRPTSLFDAVRQALAINEVHVGRRPDDLVVIVIENGQQVTYQGFEEHNAKQRKWRVRVGRVRE